MPAWTAFGVKSSSSDASSLGRSAVPPLSPPQPARAAARRADGIPSRALADMMATWVSSALRMRRRVTFSRNLTLSLSRTCRCHCKYCAFATHQTHLHEPDEVERLIDRAARRQSQGAAGADRRGARPPPGRAGEARPSSASTASPPTWCGRASGRWSAALLPHTNLGVLDRADLADLREVTASQGLMLESVNPDLVAHQGSPTKHPEQRLATIARRAGAADPVHQRDPRRHRRVRGRPHGVARGARRASTTCRR